MILGLIEHDRGKLNKSSMEMLTFAGELAEKLDTQFAPVLIGETAEQIAAELQNHSVSEIYLVKHAGLNDYAPDAWAESLVQLVRSLSPQAVMGVGTERGNEVMARLAARMNLPFSANCIAVEPGEDYKVTRIRWGGSLLEEALLHGEVKVLTLAEHTFTVEDQSAGTPAKITTFEPDLEETDFHVRVIRRIEAESGISLADATVVVGGGRGVGSAEGFSVLEDLAELLGAAVGASRVATNLGWRPHSAQIGQTGARIAPDLYIACGISGAIQHWVGCMGSKNVLAINTDPEASIVAKSDYAVIGDLHEIIPAICEALKKGSNE